MNIIEQNIVQELRALQLQLKESIRINNGSLSYYFNNLIEGLLRLLDGSINLDAFLFMYPKDINEVDRFRGLLII